MMRNIVLFVTLLAHASSLAYSSLYEYAACNRHSAEEYRPIDTSGQADAQFLLMRMRDLGSTHDPAHLLIQDRPGSDCLVESPLSGQCAITVADYNKFIKYYDFLPSVLCIDTIQHLVVLDMIRALSLDSIVRDCTSDLLRVVSSQATKSLAHSFLNQGVAEEVLGAESSYDRYLDAYNRYSDRFEERAEALYSVAFCARSGDPAVPSRRCGSASRRLLHASGIGFLGSADISLLPSDACTTLTREFGCCTLTHEKDTLLPHVPFDSALAGTELEFLLLSENRSALALLSEFLYSSFFPNDSMYLYHICTPDDGDSGRALEEVAGKTSVSPLVLLLDGLIGPGDSPTLFAENAIVTVQSRYGSLYLARSNHGTSIGRAAKREIVDQLYSHLADDLEFMEESFLSYHRMEKAFLQMKLYTSAKQSELLERRVIVEQTAGGHLTAAKSEEIIDSSFVEAQQCIPIGDFASETFALSKGRRRTPLSK